MIESGSSRVLVTAMVHPSSILRAGGDEERHRAYGDFVADLRKVAPALALRTARPRGS
jgi:hypothetical protein